MPGWYPDLDQLRRQAKRLLREAKEGDPRALRLFPRTDRSPQLADAQYAVAKAVGFSSWPALVRAVEAARHDPERRELRTRLVLVRSGQGEAQGRFNQHHGPGLVEAGRVQARRVAGRLAEIVSDDATVLSSRRRRSVETAEVISSVLGIPRGEPTCDLCEMHPGAAEGLTQQEMAERFGPNYAFVPGAESWSEFVPRALGGAGAARPEPRRADGDRGDRERGREDGVHRLRRDAGVCGRGDYDRPGSITEWSCLVQGDIRRVGTWRLERYNDTTDPTVATVR